MTRKQRYQADRRAWRQALVEGRVLKHKKLGHLTSFKTVAALEAFMTDDHVRLTVSLEEQAASLGFASVPEHWL